MVLNLCASWVVGCVLLVLMTCTIRSGVLRGVRWFYRLTWLSRLIEGRRNVAACRLVLVLLLAAIGGVGLMYRIDCFLVLKVVVVTSLVMLLFDISILMSLTIVLEFRGAGD